MPTHDKRLKQLISLVLDLHGAKGDMITVTEIVNELRIKFPFRDLHPRDKLAAETFWYSQAVKSALKEPLSDDYRERHLPYVPGEYRRLVGELTAWFYVITQGRWVFALNATAEQWQSGAEMRIEMAERTAAMAAPYQEKAEILRAKGANTLNELFARKRKGSR